MLPQVDALPKILPCSVGSAEHPTRTVVVSHQWRAQSCTGNRAGHLILQAAQASRRLLPRAEQLWRRM